MSTELDKLAAAVARVKADYGSLDDLVAAAAKKKPGVTYQTGRRRRRKGLSPLASKIIWISGLSINLIFSYLCWSNFGAIREWIRAIIYGG